MSQRERWIVYPLLFLSIAIGLRNNIGANGLPFHAEQIECRTLTVRDAAGLARVKLGLTARGGAQLELFDGAGKPLVYVGGDKSQSLGLVETLSPHGESVRLSATDSGGLIQAFSADQRVAIALGYANQVLGVMGIDRRTGQIVPLPTSSTTVKSASASDTSTKKAPAAPSAEEPPKLKSSTK